MKREKYLNLTDNKEVTEKVNKMDSSEGIEYLPICPVDISKITSSDAVLSRNFRIADLIAQHKKNVHIRGYMDYYGGYAEHTRQVVYGLADTGRYNVKVTNIKTPIDVDPLTWQKNNWFMHNPIDIENSTFMVIAGAGWLQKKFLPQNNRPVVGWTMIESMDYSEECAGWLKNADYILCPTDIDVRRTRGAGVSNTVKMRLGYDDTLFKPNLKPVAFAGLDKRFVFGVLGSWNVRKGVKEIIRAYCETFNSDDNTTLLLCCKYGNRKWGVDKDNDEKWTIQYEFNQIIEEIKKTKVNLPHIALIDIPVHETVVPHIMARFDCLVGFSSGESTWLPGIQAMAMKIPVIQLANECCGYMEYLNDTNSYLCKEVEYKTCSEGFWKTTSEYYEKQVFGYGNFAELGEKMNDVFLDSIIKINIKNKIEQAYIDSRDWTWKNSISELDKFLTLM